MSVAQRLAMRLSRWTSGKVFHSPLKTLTSRKYAERFGDRWCEVYAGAPNQRPLPQSFGTTTGELESKLCKVFPPAGVLVMEAGSLFAPEGWVVGRDDYWLPEHSWFGDSPGEARLSLATREVRRFAGTGLTLASNWSFENYGHWLLDSLPRIHLFTQAGFSFADVDYIYCPAKDAAKASAPAALWRTTEQVHSRAPARGPRASVRYAHSTHIPRHQAQLSELGPVFSTPSLAPKCGDTA